MDTDAFNRRLAIKDRLMERGKVTASEFAQEFSVSKNTIVHDISLLSMRYPISGTTGRSGGYVYAGTRSVMLTADEVEALLPYIENSDNMELKVIVKKLRSFLENKTPGKK